MKMKRRRERETSSILLIYTNTGRQGVVKPACPQMTLKAIVSARLSRPILGVGTTMAHRKMEHGSQVSEGPLRKGFLEALGLSATAKWYGAALKGEGK
jgi:hypothetical protein